MRIKHLIILFAALVVLSLYYFLFETEKYLDHKIKKQTVKKIFNIEKTNINKIMLNNSSGRITIVKNNNNWLITVPEKKEARTESVNKYLSLISKIEIIMSLGDNIDDISPFGLNEPSIEITLQQKDLTNSLSIVIGNYNPNMTCAYARTNISPEIFLIGSLFKEDLDTNLNFFLKTEEK